jgi:DNA processing protein
VSEYPPDTPPARWQYPARNRIIAGLSRGTVVIEAPARSGALITASFALEAGRDIWVSDAGLRPPHGDGTMKLVQDGARVVKAIDGVLDEWQMLRAEHEVHHAKTLAEKMARELELL